MMSKNFVIGGVRLAAHAIAGLLSLADRPFAGGKVRS